MFTASITAQIHEEGVMDGEPPQPSKMHFMVQLESFFTILLNTVLTDHFLSVQKNKPISVSQKVSLRDKFTIFQVHIKVVLYRVRAVSFTVEKNYSK